MQTLLFIFGTRPEAVKMAPLIKECEKYPKDFKVKIAVTGQHREMLDQVLEFFNIKPDYDLNLMKPNQTLFDITADALRGMEKILNEVKPDLVIVQGDTTTVFTGALAAFYKQIPIAHLEAGLRSGDKYSPFPEEMNRILTGHIADYHWAPTEKAKRNLLAEGIKEEKIFVVQNTVIDALLLALELLKKEGDSKYKEFFKDIDFNKKIVLITAHRRESFGEPFENICNAVKELSSKYPDVEFVYPVHLNPNVREVVYRILSNISNVHLIEPLEYPYMVWMMNKSYMVLTDSGGVQEEAPSLGIPIIITRTITERPEILGTGMGFLVGTDQDSIFQIATEILSKERVKKAKNIFGDGLASQRIVQSILFSLGKLTEKPNEFNN